MRAPPKSERMGTEGSHPYKKHEDLVANLASACPAWVAYADEGAPSGERKWFAAATRVRGQALKDMSDTSQVLLFQPRILPYPSKADAYMPNLHVKICFPLPPASAESFWQSCSRVWGCPPGSRGFLSRTASAGYQPSSHACC